MNKAIRERIRKTAKKLYIIRKLGDCCANCGDDRFYVLNFHHTNEDKEFNFCGNMTTRISVLEKEADKCIILCANCHQKHHMKIQNEYDKRTNTKRTLFEYIGTSACKCCGESDSRILAFHHTRDKSFAISGWITNKNIKDVSKLSQEIKDELDKCVLLCPNCHLTEHYEHEFFETYKVKIIDKSNNIKEVMKPLNREEVKQMYLDGMRQIDIARQFGTVKSTISDILKSFGLTTPMSEIVCDQDLILKLYNEGKYNFQISNETGYKRATINTILHRLGLKNNLDPDRNKSRRKFDPTPEELNELLETKTYKEIGELFNVSGVSVFNRKKKFDKMLNKS